METDATLTPLPTLERSACPNCGAATDEDRFCSACGQRQRAFRQPVHVFARDLAAEYFGFEGKLWRTVLALLRPGRLTVDYLEGRQRQYARPLRLYLTASLLFFFLVSLLNPEERLRRGILDGSSSVVKIETTVAEALEQVEAERAALNERRRALQTLADSGATTLPDSLAFAPADSSRPLVVFGREVESELVREIGRIQTREDAARVLPRVVQSAVPRLPNAMFVLLPAFALLLKLLYARRRRYYGEHLVFAFHVHAFWFACFSLAIVLATLLAGGEGAARVLGRMLWSALTLGLPLYTVLAMRRVYGQGWGKTLVKAWALLWCYAFLLLLGAAGVLVLTLVL